MSATVGQPAGIFGRASVARPWSARAAAVAAGRRGRPGSRRAGSRGCRRPARRRRRRRARRRRAARRSSSPRPRAGPGRRPRPSRPGRRRSPATSPGRRGRAGDLAAQVGLTRPAPASVSRPRGGRARTSREAADQLGEPLLGRQPGQRHDVQPGPAPRVRAGRSMPLWITSTGSRGCHLRAPRRGSPRRRRSRVDPAQPGRWRRPSARDWRSEPW